MFQIDISCRFGSSCACLHIDNSGYGNKQITNVIKVEVENVENVTKLKATVQHLSENMLTV